MKGYNFQSMSTFSVVNEIMNPLFKLKATVWRTNSSYNTARQTLCDVTLVLQWKHFQYKVVGLFCGPESI